MHCHMNDIEIKRKSSISKFDGDIKVEGKTLDTADCDAIKKSGLKWDQCPSIFMGVNPSTLSDNSVQVLHEKQDLEVTLCSGHKHSKY